MSGALCLDCLPAALRGRIAYGRAALPAAAGDPWGLAACAGRMVELSGGGDSAALTLAVGLVAAAQREGENVAWVAATDLFFPPDAAAAGIDLAALPVVQIPVPLVRKPYVRGAGEVAEAAARAALHILRGGCFALVVVDLGRGSLPPAAAPLLARLARRHGTALVCLTAKGEGDASLSPLVSLRLHAVRGAAEGGCFACGLTALRDRLRGGGWHYVERFRGPAGLC